MKRLIELIFALIIFIVLLPVFLVTAFLIYINDFENPFFIATRVGKSGRKFKMFKFRSMSNDPKYKHIVSTSEDDPRITWIGKIIRKLKVDEFSQIINVVIGNMSFVGPRPNVITETNLYTDVEKVILSVKPGITDISSIVFSDLNTILKNSKDVNLDYNQLVRPWKSRLAILYIENRTFMLDISLVILTLLNSLSREYTLQQIANIVAKRSDDKLLIQVAGRKIPLFPFPPPGSDSIVTVR